MATAKLPVSIGHVFYDVLNRLLLEEKFDNFAEALCEPFCKEDGRRAFQRGSTSA